MKTETFPVSSYVDKDIKNVEIQTIKRGLYKVVISWLSTVEQASVTFYTKKEAVSYYKWLTMNPSHPIHKIF